MFTKTNAQSLRENIKHGCSYTEEHGPGCPCMPYFPIPSCHSVTSQSRKWSAASIVWIPGHLPTTGQWPPRTGAEDGGTGIYPGTMLESRYNHQSSEAINLSLDKEGADKISHTKPRTGAELGGKRLHWVPPSSAMSWGHIQTSDSHWVTLLCDASKKWPIKHWDTALDRFILC